MARSAPDPAQLDFVLSPDTSAVEVLCRASYDLYVRPVDRPVPLALFVHGPVRGPVVRPREWPVYRGYAALAADAGVAAAVADLDYTDVHALDGPISQLEELVSTARTEEAVDRDRVAVWAFSGGGRLVGHWLESPPEWMRGVALTYPVAPSVTRVRVPLVVTRVGREQPSIQATVDQLLAAAPAAEVIRLDDGQHGFDMLDHNRESQRAVTAAVEAVVRLLS
jgi:dienelactone hydrolase